LIHGPLEFLLPATHRRKRAGAGIAILGGQRAGECELAAAAVLLALGLGRAGDLGRGNAARRQGRSGCATGALDWLGLLLVVRDRCGRRAAAGFLLGAAAGFGLGLKAGLFLGLAACGLLTLALAAFLFLGTAARILGSAGTLLSFARLGALKRATAGFHLVARKLVQHQTLGRLRRGRPRHLRRFAT